jgi:GNAT superfamily N-acetyltransferase
MTIFLRPAIDADAPVLTAIHLAARVSADIPNLHDEADVTAFHHRLIAAAQVRVAVLDGVPVAYASVKDGWLEQLWVLPAYHRRGIGRALLAWARTLGELHLYVFTHNRRARAFYAAHGAVRVAETDGSGNEERLPDLTLRFPALP